MNDLKKQLQEALKAEMKPLLIGLRNDNKELIKQLEKIVAKRPPEIQTVKVENPIEKVEIINQPETPRMSIISDSVAKMTTTLTKGLRSIREAVRVQSGEFKRILTENILKVEVKNQIRPPKVQDVKITNFQKQQEVQDVWIKNQKPRDAIPVVLTDRTLKEFYSVVGAFASDINLAGLKKKLDTINATLLDLDVTIEAGDISIGAVELKDETTDVRVNVTDDSGKNAVFVQSKSLATEITLDAIKSQTDLLKFIGERLKVDAEVIVTTEPRPGLRFAKFLENGGSSAMNVDGSTTPVTFQNAPPTGKRWNICTLSLILEDTSINHIKFGGIAGGLTNGIEFKVKEGGLAEASLGVFKVNGDFYAFTSDIILQSAVTDIFSFTAIIKQLAGTVFELDNSRSDVFKVIVNDDLTSINRFNILIRGFEVDE